MSSTKKSASSSNNLKYAVVALLCALPFALAGVYLENFAKRVDTLPFDMYSGLRWVPGTSDLFYLHRPLDRTPPSPTDVWRVTSNGTLFNKVGSLSADFDWSTTSSGAGGWQLLEGENEDGEKSRVLCNLIGETKPVEVEKEWQPARSKGDGIFYYRVDSELPFDQFVEVEEAPASLPEPVSFEPEPEPSNTPSDGEPTPQVPTRKGVRVGEYLPDEGKVEPLFSIPYNAETERPSIELMRRSPDSRFLAMVVKFGSAATPGLWIYDQEGHRLLWTRVLVQGEAMGLSWSPDSVKVAVTDVGGLVVLEQALGVESTRVEMSTTVGLQPVWGTEDSLYLYGEHAVYSVDLDGDVAVPVLEAPGSEELRLNVAESRVAYSTSVQGFHELVLADLKTGDTLSQAPYPGAAKQEAQSTLTYKVGSALRYALNRWTGRG